jgi:hypothetical protein
LSKIRRCHFIVLFYRFHENVFDIQLFVNSYNLNVIVCESYLADNFSKYFTVKSSFTVKQIVFFSRVSLTLSAGLASLLDFDHPDPELDDPSTVTMSLDDVLQFAQPIVSDLLY